MTFMSNLQVIIDRHAAATPSPQFIDDHGTDGKSWMARDD